MSGLTPKQYMEQWIDLNSKENPKPPPEEIERLKKEYRAERRLEDCWIGRIRNEGY